MNCVQFLSPEKSNNNIAIFPTHPQGLVFLDQLSKPSAPTMVSILALNSDYWSVLQDHPLTKRELDVLRLIVDGYTNAAIAQKLYLSVGTIKTHVRNILSKFNVHDRTQAAVIALRAGLVN